MRSSVTRVVSIFALIALSLMSVSILAQENVAKLLVEGAGALVKGDPASARRMVEAQVAESNPIAQYIYSVALVNTGLKEGALNSDTLIVATDLLLKSARSGYVPAMRDLAHLLYLHDPAPNPKLFLRWYLDAANAGDAESALFIMLSTQKNPKIAMGMAQRAMQISQIDEYKRFAQIGIDNLKAKVSEQELLQLQADAMTWKPIYKSVLKQAYQEHGSAVSASLKETPLLLYGMNQNFFGSSASQKIGKFVSELTGLSGIYSTMIAPQIGVIGKF
jgi:TPR repeat protein